MNESDFYNINAYESHKHNFEYKKQTVKKYLIKF